MENNKPKINILTADQKTHLIACKEKQKQTQKEWFQANKEKMREYQNSHLPHEGQKTRLF